MTRHDESSKVIPEPGKEYFCIADEFLEKSELDTLKKYGDLFFKPFKVKYIESQTPKRVSNDRVVPDLSLPNFAKVEVSEPGDMQGKEFFVFETNLKEINE